MRLYEFSEIRLACLKCDIGQVSPEQFISQPNAIGVDHIAFAVIRNLTNVTIAKIFLHLCAANADWLTWQSHHAADLMQSRFKKLDVLTKSRDHFISLGQLGIDNALPSTRNTTAL